VSQDQQSKIKHRLRRHQAKCATNPQCDVATQAGSTLLQECLADAYESSLRDTQRGMILFERDTKAISSYAVDSLQWDQIPFTVSTGLSIAQVAQVGVHRYDVLLSNLAFDWVDAGGFIQLLHSLLSDSGRFWFSCFGAGTANTTRSILAGLDSRAHFNDFFELQDVGDALFSAGFKDVSVSSTVFKLEYTDFAVLMADAHGIFGLNMNSQAQPVVYDRVTYRAFRARVEAEIQEQGVFTEHIEIMVAHGNKAPMTGQAAEIPVRLG